MKIRGSSWKFALILLAGIIITAQLLFLVRWRWRFWQHHSQQETLPPGWTAMERVESENEEEPDRQQIYTPPREQADEDNGPSGADNVQPTSMDYGGQRVLSPKPIVQELICPRKEHSAGCFVVMDGPDPSGRGFSRYLLTEPKGQGTMAESALKFPSRYNFTKENARQWPVLTDQLQLDYQRLSALQPSITGTFPDGLDFGKIADGETKRILCLGLLGSAVNNFFANLSTEFDVTVVEPERTIYDLAQKWFGLQENAHHRVFIENPAFYVTARARLIEDPSPNAKMPSPFDFILVDVCTGLGAQTPGKCPTDEFESEQTALALSKNLGENGTIVIHFSSSNANLEMRSQQQHQLANHEHQIRQVYQKHFKNCYFVSIGVHLLLTCTRRPPLTRASYLMAFRSLPKEMQISQIANQEAKFFLDIEALKR